MPKQIFIWIFLPLISGVAIYILARPEHTLLAVVFSHHILNLPGWIKYNLPDGLWLFALLNAYVFIWGKQHFRQNLYWVMGTTLLAVSTEYLQRFHIIPGTFDYTDILFYLAAFTATFFLLIFSNYKQTQKQ